MNQGSRNGRIDIMQHTPGNQFELFDKIHVNDNSSFRDAMVGNWSDNQLSKAFFSGENIQIIQNGIRAGVYKKSNGLYNISNQDTDTVKIIMRSIFLQHSANMATNIKEQISALNKLVLDFCIPRVYGQTQGYIKYKKDVSTLPVPMGLPIKASTDNTKTLELKNFF